jgi:hypothetical protein
MHDHHVGNTFRYLPPGATFVAPDVQQSLPVLVGFNSEVAALIEVRWCAYRSRSRNTWRRVVRDGEAMNTRTGRGPAAAAGKASAGAPGV